MAGKQKEPVGACGSVAGVCSAANAAWCGKWEPCSVAQVAWQYAMCTQVRSAGSSAVRGVAVYNGVARRTVGVRKERCAVAVVWECVCGVTGGKGWWGVGRCGKVAQGGRKVGGGGARKVVWGRCGVVQCVCVCVCVVCGGKCVCVSPKVGRCVGKVAGGVSGVYKVCVCGGV